MKAARFKVTESNEEGQIRIECVDVPDADERVILKANGFRMVGHDPKVWSRFMTESARQSADRASMALNL